MHLLTRGSLVLTSGVSGPRGPLAPAHRAVCRAVALACAASLASASFALASGTYYVDNTSANCAAAGPGTEAQPYCTISAALAAQGGPGTTIIVKPGVYRERIVVNASGAPGDPLVIRAEGPGVIIDGADDFADASKWAPFASSVWLAASVAWSPGQVFADGGRLAVSTDDPALLTPGSFRFVDGQGLYVNVGGDNPGDHQMLVGRRRFGIHLIARPWVTFEGFEVLRAEEKGIFLTDGSDNCVVGGNTVSWCRSNGIAINGCSGVVVERNHVSNNTHHGISLRLGTSGTTVQENESHHNQGAISGGFTDFATGIYVSGAPYNTVVRNRVHDNEDTGLEIQNGSNECISSYNLSWSNGDHGFAHVASTGTRDLGNVAWANHTDGFSIEGSSTATSVFNCIAVDNGGRDLVVDAGSIAGFLSNCNIFWNSIAQKPIRFGGVSYATIGDYQAASGQDGQSFQADPMFVDPIAGNFHLLLGSPAIDSGTSAVPGWQAADADGHGRYDEPLTANVGAGPPIDYTDRGAFEFVISGPVAVGDPPAQTGLSLSNAYPNPTRGPVTFRLELPREARVDWGIYDLQGRKMWGGGGTYAAGRTAFVWSQTQAAGAPLAGVYFARFDVEGQRMTRRFAMVR